MKDNWCSGKFYHLKDVCWNDPTGMFQRYKEMVRSSNGLQEPKVLAIFYTSIPDMKALFLKVSFTHGFLQTNVYKCQMMGII